SAAVIGGLGIWLAGMLGLSFSSTIMGVGGGVIIAVVQSGTPLARLCGFLIGFVLGIFFTAMRLGLLPGGSSVAGMAVALVIVMLIITIVSGFTADRISAWTMLLGGLVFISGFLPVTSSAPWTASAQLPAYCFSLLAMAGIGFLTIIPAELVPDRGTERAQAPNRSANPTPAAVIPESSPQSAAHLDEMLGGSS
ncbi:MAG: hypothetical protein WCP28_06015, partial [Actinomycetes bacterium]